MDVGSSKQAVGGIAAPKKRSATALKDTAGSQNQNGTPPQFCNRIGCCGRLNHTKLAKNKCPEKPKAPKPSLRSSSLKEVTATSSKTCSSVPNVKKPLPESEKKIFLKTERKTPKESTTLPNKSGIQERKLKSRNTEGAAASSSSSSRTKKVYTQSGSSSVMENSQIESNSGRRRRFFQGESSSSGKGKRANGFSANEGGSVVSTCGISVSDPKNSKPNGVSSVRTRRSLKMDSSKGSVDLSSVQSVDPISDTSHDETLSSSEDTSTDHPVVRFVNPNATRRYNLDGIADVLLALDRIEQNEELTYEQLLSLEANLFLGGLNLYDQHRDMRLNIDNMSYEELLALEEKMGTVSTALSEEEISKCIRISEYESVQLEDGRMRHSLGAEDSKCSICQEEFVRGDEIGRLGCKHGYHNSCINQWLGLKNWCPICKSPPKPSASLL